MEKTIYAKDMKDGDVMLLPFGKEAHLTNVEVGRKYVHWKSEYGPARCELYDIVQVKRSDNHAEGCGRA